MNKNGWLGILLTGTILFGITGCGNNSNTAQGSNSNWQSQGGQRTFQLNIDMTTTPSQPTAGKPFTIQFTMKRPNRTGGNTTQNSTGSGHRLGNWSGGSQGGNSPMQPTLKAQIKGGDLNQTLDLTNQNGVIKGQATVQKAGAYQITVTMNIGQRQVQKQFTLQVNP
jgi:hypothetical protein